MITPETIIPYDDIDSEIRELVKCLNDIDGVQTTSSCFGHGEYNCYICTTVNNCETLNRLMFHCFNHSWDWQVKINTADPDRSWKDIHIVIESRDICTQNNIDSLTRRIREQSKYMKMSNDEWLNLRTDIFKSMTREEAKKEMEEEFEEFLKGSGYSDKGRLEKELKENIDLRKVVLANKMAIEALNMDSPCDLCMYDPLPSPSGDEKPCTNCPAKAPITRICKLK